MILMLSPIDPRWTGMWGALAMRPPAESNTAQEKSSRSLMLTECDVLRSRTPICSATDMNRLLKISSMTGSTAVPAERWAGRACTRARSRSPRPVCSACQPGSSTVVAKSSTIRAGPVMIWPTERSGRRIAGTSTHFPETNIATGGTTPGGTAPSVRTAPPGAAAAKRDHEGGICPLVPEVGPADGPDLILRDALVREFGPRRRLELARHLGQPGQQFRRQRRLHRGLAHRGHLGEPHPVRGQHPSERVDQNPGHAQFVGHGAGVLATRAAEGGQDVGRDVVATLDRDLLDRVGHVGHRDLQKSRGDLLRRGRAAALAATALAATGLTTTGL